MEQIQNTEELADGGFHTLECHRATRNVLQQLDCIYPERLVDEAKMPAVRAIHKEMPEQFANKLPARMVRSQSVHVLIHVQFMVS